MRRLHAVELALISSLALGCSPGVAESTETSGALPGRPATSTPRAAGHVGMLAYSKGNVFTIRTDGSHRRKLTTSGGYGPVWSPDGTRIAFMRDNGIEVMDASGSARRRVVDGLYPAWAPDGQRLTYSCREGIDEAHPYGFSDLCLYDLRDGTETVIVDHTDDWHGVEGSTWSPDGAWIAVTRISAEGDDYVRDRQLFRVRPDGSQPTAIPGTEPLAKQPVWSPDGETILYTASYDGRGGEGTGGLMSIRPDGTGLTAVTRGLGAERNATWSSDGLRIAMDSDGGLVPSMGGIWTINPDGSGKELVVRDAQAPSWRPGWSTAPAPDNEVKPASGPRIAYIAATDDGFDLFTVRPDGKKIRQLTSTGRVVDPTWSPDHSQIAYGDAAFPEFAKPMVVDVRSGKTKRVGRSFTPSLGGVAWSPSGRQLVWGDFRSLVVVDVRTRERRSIPFKGDACCLRDPTWSPDGTQIAFSIELHAGGNDIMVVPAHGGAPEKVTRLRGMERHLDWSPDGARIMFTHQRSAWHDGDVDVMSVRPDGTGLRKVVGTPELDLAPAWSPGGRRKAFYSDGPRPFGDAPQAGLWTVGPGGVGPQLVVRDRNIAYVDW